MWFEGRFYLNVTSARTPYMALRDAILYSSFAVRFSSAGLSGHHQLSSLCLLRISICGPPCILIEFSRKIPTVLTLNLPQRHNEASNILQRHLQLKEKTDGHCQYKAEVIKVFKYVSSFINISF